MPDKFNIDDDMVTDKFEIALNFNNFYVNIGKKLSTDIPTNSGDPLSYIKSAVPGVTCVGGERKFPLSTILR